jgi:hypothetical protein
MGADDLIFVKCLIVMNLTRISLNIWITQPVMDTSLNSRVKGGLVSRGSPELSHYYLLWVV